MGDKLQPYHQDNSITIYNKDCRSMSEIPNETVQMVITSPPYWGLRKYKGNQDLVWGDNHCQHEWIENVVKHHTGTNAGRVQMTNALGEYNNNLISQSGFCSLCGAWRGAYGLEPTPELYCQHTVEILREVRRVLRSDGTVFLNIGDSYFGGGNNRGNNSPISDKQASNFGAVGQCAEHQKNIGKHPILKPKDLCLIPFRVAIAAQEDGWWVRSVIIWNKPNPMPESVRDRPTESHEYILMLTKSSRYYWDMEAVRENGTGRNWADTGGSLMGKGIHKLRDDFVDIGDRTGREDATGRNLRSVWTFPTQPYPEAHFATFPEALPERCIKAATPEVGCCSKCGKPWVRIVENKPLNRTRPDGFSAGELKSGTCGSIETQTLGWQPTCKCNADTVPSIVLDPFAGSGTTLWVAKKLGRQAIGYELSEEYCQLALERNRQMALANNG